MCLGNQIGGVEREQNRSGGRDAVSRSFEGKKVDMVGELKKELRRFLQDRAHLSMFSKNEKRRDN